MSPLGTYVVETLVTLLGMIALAAIVLYAARRAGVGRTAGPLELVGRLPLDGRRAVYLVRVETMVYVLGGSEAGLTKLGQFEQTELSLEAPPTTRSFSEVLGRALGRAAVPVKPAGTDPQQGSR